MGCLLDLPSSGKPSGLLDWLWQTELGQPDPADQPDCSDLRCQPGRQPRNGEKKKKILRNNAKIHLGSLIKLPHVIASSGQS